MKSYNKFAVLAGMPAIAALGSMSLPVFGDNGSFMDEIVVTAQKREQDISTVPIAITAFTGEQLEANNLVKTEDLEIVTPGLMVDDAGLGGAATTFTIRGVAQSNFEDHNEGPIAIYQDGAYISMLGGLNFAMFDIDRVEVLRGPQGTLFGRNATGGLVHVITKQPTDEFEGYVKANYGTYDTYGLEGAVSGALSDSIRGRLSVKAEETGGYGDNDLGGQLDDFGNSVKSDDAGEGNSISIRGQLAFDISDTVSLALRSNYGDADYTPGGYQVFSSAPDPANDFLGTVLPANVANTTSFCVLPFAYGPQAPGNDCLGYRDPDSDLHDGSWDTPGKYEAEAKGVTAQFDIAVGGMELVSITDFRNLERAYSEDTDGGPRAGILFSTVQDTDQFSQEIRLSGASDSLKWVVGAYYLNIDGEYESDLDFGIPFFDSNAILDADADYELETESSSLFGEAEFTLNDELSLIAGVRYTEDDKDFKFVQNCDSLVGNCGPAPLPFGQNPIFNGTKDEDDIAARVVLNWMPNEDWFVYAGVTRGNKAGGFNAPATADIPDSKFDYDAEILTNYEVGFKATLWDGKVRLNASLFHYDYEDYQAFAFTAGKTIVFNTDAEVDGAEIELFTRPFDNSNLELMLGVSLLDAEVDDITLPSGRIADGQDMPNSPDLTVSGSLSDSWDLPGGDVVRATINFNYVDERHTNVQNHPFTELDSYAVVNARLSYTTENDAWEFAAFVRNLGDEEYAAYSLDAADNLGLTIKNYGAPRTGGVEATYRF